MENKEQIHPKWKNLSKKEKGNYVMGISLVSEKFGKITIELFPLELTEYTILGIENILTWYRLVGKMPDFELIKPSDIYQFNNGED